MAHLMAQKAHAPRFCAALHFHHHLFFESFQSWMGKIKRDGDGRASFGTKPFIAEVTEGLEGDPLGGELTVKCLDSRFEFGTGDFEPQIANTHLQELIIAQASQFRDRSCRLRRFGHLLAFRGVHPGYFSRGGLKRLPRKWNDGIAECWNSRDGRVDSAPATVPLCPASAVFCPYIVNMTLPKCSRPSR